VRKEKKVLEKLNLNVQGDQKATLKGCGRIWQNLGGCEKLGKAFP
jgi:hypothetical protein